MTRLDDQTRVQDKADEDLHLAKETLEDLDTTEDEAGDVQGGSAARTSTKATQCGMC